MPYRLKVDPRRQYERRLMDEPRVRKSRSERLLDIFMVPYKLRELPHLQ
jgi:hypothetical protein